MVKKTNLTVDYKKYRRVHNYNIMNTNEKCLIKYLSDGKYKQGADTYSLIKFLMNYGIKFSFCDLNPVCNIIDELEFFDDINYN